MNQTYRDFYRARVISAVAAAKAATGISHGGIKGEIREILLRDLFRPLLPADIGVGTGQVISAYTNELSRQQDILLYDRRILPPILFEGRIGLFPIESVLYAIEVKSKLNADELRTSNEAARHLLSLPVAPGKYDDKGNPVHHVPIKPIYTIFAFETDLTQHGKTELERYKELLTSDKIDLTQGPPIRAICVVDRGDWYWDCLKEHWKSWNHSYPLEEVVGFIAGVMNTYKIVAASRLEPRLGVYLC